MACTPSPSKRGGKKDCITNTDPRYKLRDYNVFVKRRETIPQAIQTLINVLLTPRQQESPNAKIVAKRQPGAAEMKEIDAINFLEAQILLMSAKDGGEDFVEVCRNENLARNFLPTTTIPVAAPLEQAQPDTAIGYIREGLARVLEIKFPFTQQEDQDLARFQVCGGLHAPFFTCQWKGAKNPNHTAAQNQGARRCNGQLPAVDIPDLKLNHLRTKCDGYLSLLGYL
jgi:hypothetical protein